MGRVNADDEGFTHLDEDEHDVEDHDPAIGPSTNWLERGQTIGRYVVLECLAIGGMGVVYAARDPQLDRKLAIKLVRTREGSLDSPRGRARLLREAQALARLRHPNVIAVHDVGTHDGRVFVAMEFVEGQTLSRWLSTLPAPRDTPATIAALSDVFLQFGRGLAAAHRGGLVHRDVKPDNVMLGDDGRVLVLDFGIAREGAVDEDETATKYSAPERPTPVSTAIETPPEATIGSPSEASSAHMPTAGEADDACDPSDLERTHEPGVPAPIDDRFTPLADLTRAGAVLGTPAYMSPEQHRRQRLDPRSDQFSFCVAMWEGLNDERPFGDGQREKLLARMRLGQFRPFHNRTAPRHVATALRRGLAWRPADRFPTMEALLEALNPRPQRRKALRPTLSPARAWAVLGSSAALAVTTVSVVLWPAPPAPPPACPAATVTAKHGPGDRAAATDVDRQRRRALTAELEALERRLARADLDDPRVAQDAQDQLIEAAGSAARLGEFELEARALTRLAAVVLAVGDAEQAGRWLILAEGVAARTQDANPPLAPIPASE